MKSGIGMLTIALLVTGCASEVKQATPEPIKLKQSVTIDARDQKGMSLVNANCSLSNDRGSWTLTSPGSVLVTHSLSPLSVSCVKDNLAGLAVVTSGTQAQTCKGVVECAYPSVVIVEMKGASIPVTKFRVVGYGAPPSDLNMSSAQKKLLAMRGSKADAYRALTEQLYGVRITGNTTVGDMVVKSDTFRLYLDSYVHGAKVVNVEAQSDGIYTTELELSLGDDFYNQVSSSKDCDSVPGGVGPGCAYPNRAFYLSK